MTIRQRRSNKHQSQKKKKVNKSPNNTVSKAKTGDENESESLYTTFISHPIVIITTFVAIPYGIYLLYFYLVLQRPDILNNITLHLFSFRPAVRIEDQRQLLIVGSMSAGTKQVTEELVSKLNIEIAHESSDSQWTHARDGTVSWFHGIRFMNPPAAENRYHDIAKLCITPLLNKTNSMIKNMGFHPSMYRPPKHGCSYRKEWDKCWAKECIEIIENEWGCAKRKDCEINFQSNLHQVRNPLRTMESLYVKFCQKKTSISTDSNQTLVEETIHPSFVLFANTMFRDLHDFTNDSCFDAVGYFVVFYNNALIEARNRGEIDSFYRIENVSSCDIAKVAGWMEANSSIYLPNHETIRYRCSKKDKHTANKKIAKEVNLINKDYVRFEWNDFRTNHDNSSDGQTQSDLEHMVKDLFIRLGYDFSEEK